MNETGRGALLRDVTDEDWRVSRMGQFAAAAAARWGHRLSTYDELWGWSVAQPEEFWPSVVEFFELDLGPVTGPVLAGSLPAVTWMAGAHCNYAQAALRPTGPGLARHGISQTRDDVRLSWDDLRRLPVAGRMVGSAGLSVRPACKSASG